MRLFGRAVQYGIPLATVLASFIGKSVRSEFGQSTAGSKVVATIHTSHSSFPLRSSFLKEGVLGSKNLFSERCLECPKTYE